MTKINSPKIKIIVLTIVSIFLIFKFRKTDNEVEAIKSNHIVCCGTISSIRHGRGGLIINYEFSSGDKLIKSSGSCTKYTEERFRSGISHNIMVVIKKNDLFVNRLIESTADLEKYKILSKDTVGLNCLYIDY